MFDYDDFALLICPSLAKQIIEEAIDHRESQGHTYCTDSREWIFSYLPTETVTIQELYECFESKFWFIESTIEENETMHHAYDPDPEYSAIAHKIEFYWAPRKSK